MGQIFFDFSPGLTEQVGKESVAMGEFRVQSALGGLQEHAEAWTLNNGCCRFLNPEGIRFKSPRSEGLIGVAHDLKEG